MFNYKLLIVFLFLTLYSSNTLQTIEEIEDDHNQFRELLSTTDSIKITTSIAEENESTIKYHLIHQTKKISGIIEKNIIKTIKFGVKAISKNKYPNILISLSTQNFIENEIEVYCSPLKWLVTKGQYPNSKLYHWRTSMAQGKDIINISSESMGFKNAYVDSTEIAAFMCSVINSSDKINEFKLDIQLNSNVDVNLIESEKLVMKNILEKCCLNDESCLNYRKNETTFELDACHVGGNFCDKNGNLVRLDMSNSGLNCPFPYLQLKQLTKLEKLYMDNNKMSEDVSLIFEHFINSKKLKYLNLAKCSLHGSLLSLDTNSSDLCNCFENNNLKYINLDSNLITGNLPRCLFSDNSTIVEFNIAQNKLEGNVHVNISIDSNLEALTLSYNKFSGYLPESIGNAKKLKFLNLQYNQFSGPLPEALGSLHNLNIIRLNGNNFTKFPESWNGNWSPGSKLKLVDISKNAIDSEFPKSLLKAEGMEYLDLSDNKLNGKLKSEKSMYQNCLYFNVSNNNFEGSIPDDYKSMKIFSRSAIISNIYCVFDIRNNNLTGFLPNFFYTKYAYPLSTKHIFISGNNITCRIQSSKLNYISNDIQCHSNRENQKKVIKDELIVKANGNTYVSNQNNDLRLVKYKKLSVVDVFAIVVSGIIAIVILSGIVVLMASCRRKYLEKRGLLYVAPQEIEIEEIDNRL